MFESPAGVALIAAALLSFVFGRFGLLFAVPALVVLARWDECSRKVFAVVAAGAALLHALAWYRASITSPFGADVVFVLDHETFATGGFGVWFESVVGAAFGVVAAAFCVAVVVVIPFNMYEKRDFGVGNVAVGLAVLAAVVAFGLWGAGKMRDRAALFFGTEDDAHVLAITRGQLKLVHTVRPTRVVPLADLVGLETKCTTYQVEGEDGPYTVYEEKFVAKLRDGTQLRGTNRQHGHPARVVLEAGETVRALAKREDFRHVRLAFAGCDGYFWQSP